ncbi:MAG: hypothetical protein JNL85_03675 [Rubrivivax sp.]|nr:hypothetical protein [Rubrivivax sp.]
MNALAALAAALLVLAALIYLLDRPAGSAWLLPAQWQARWQAWWPAPASGGWFGSAGLWLPSFVHAFAFSVLTAWLLPPRPALAATACAGWALVDTLAELGQHAAVSPHVAAAITALFGHSSAVLHTARYFSNGSFAAADIVAALAGSAVAFAATWWAISPQRARMCSLFPIGR